MPDKLAAVVHILAATEVIQSEMAYSVENEKATLIMACWMQHLHLFLADVGMQVKITEC